MRAILPGTIEFVATVTFEQAREIVVARVTAERTPLGTEGLPLLEADGRVLAECIRADRDYPPFPKSMRDGFAVRACDLPGELDIIGEVRAGESYAGSVGSRQALEIMTGAPVPDGADAVAMVEHSRVNGARVALERALERGENVNPQGIDARRGAIVLEAGRRIGYAEIGLLATVGKPRVTVFRKPDVAILATGDELVPVEDTPLKHQIRNSNAWSVAAQTARAGGSPVQLSVARDTYEATRELIEQGLSHDLLLLSGGVSAGRYDVVERVLADLGAEFYFDRVLIQPGQPLVFGRARGKFFFGLPGNPASTMVTFEIFARAALGLLSGQSEVALPLLRSCLARELRQKKGLTRFLPGRLSADGAEATPIGWSGSGDVPALARANAFLVTEPERELWAAGEAIRVLMK
jgi:molybdopterin molybdotransferase